MSVRVRERWSARRLSFTEPWKAYREFTVDGVDSEDGALTAVDAETSLAIPQKEDGHNKKPELLFCDGPVVKDAPGPTSWVIGCGYSDQSVGATGKDNFTRIKWETVEVCLPVDSDLDHRPILNAAGAPILGASRRITYKRLILTKKFPYFDSSLCVRFENATNEKACSFDEEFIDIQHMRVCSIQPTIEYTTQTKLIPIEFKFDILFDDSLGKYPFQHRLLNASQTGWYTDPDSGKKVPGRFSDGRGDILGLDVRLDDTGLPLPGPYKDVKVGPDNQDPATPTKATNYLAKEIYANDGTLTPAVGNDTQAVFFYFKESRVVDLTDLTKLLTNAKPAK